MPLMRKQRVSFVPVVRHAVAHEPASRISRKPPSTGDCRIPEAADCRKPSNTGSRRMPETVDYRVVCPCTWENDV